VSRYCSVPCGDGNFRHCIPVLTIWLPDCPDYSGLHHLELHVCSWCECSNNELREDVPQTKQQYRRVR
jgi:hypothetical protein